MPERKYGQTLPEVLSPEWMRAKAEGMIHDFRILLKDMGPEDSERFAGELKKISEDYFSKEKKSID